MQSAGQPSALESIGPVGEMNQDRCEQLRRTAHRIVVVRALYLGDIVVATPALETLRRRLPDAEVTFVGLPWSETVLRRLGLIDRFLAFPGYPGIPEVDLNPDRLAEFLDTARAYRYDLAIQLHGDGTVMNHFIAKLGARYSLGYAPSGQPPLLTFSVPYPGEMTHEV